jgi:adenylate cyclase
MSLRIDAIRDCFESPIPAMLCTVAADGMPNLAYMSQVQFIDSDHLALSWQFMNRTRKNFLDNARASLTVTDPVTMARYGITLEFQRSETEGALFECMKARLAGIASHTGLSGVMRLLGADIFRVLEVECLPGETLPAPAPRLNMLSALRTCVEVVSTSGDLDRLLTGSLIALQAVFDIQHSMVLLYDERSASLFTMATRGYDVSGVGSEIPLGHGLIGVAARERTAIRIANLDSAYAYGRAVREQTRHSDPAALETEIPLPGLHTPRSQLAAPILMQDKLIGMLFVESGQELRFTYDDEDALMLLAAQMGLSIAQLQAVADSGDDTLPAASRAPLLQGAPLVIRHYPENDSIFLDDDYLIKGVAGSIFYMLVEDFIEKGRTEFSNRELRLDSRIKLPDLSDNLEARLLLLSRRLVDRRACVRIEKTGRGRFSLQVSRPLQMVDASLVRA